MKTLSNLLLTVSTFGCIISAENELSLLREKNLLLTRIHFRGIIRVHQGEIDEFTKMVIR